MVYILIMIIGSFSSQTGYSTVIVEFNNLEACQNAQKHIAASVLNPNSNDRDVKIKSQGCYPKGAREFRKS